MASTFWPRDEVLSERCPMHCRRSSKEVWMKLFVVHLTSIAAFCHVLSSRRRRIWSWTLIAYLLHPSTILAGHALAVIIFAGAVIYWILLDRTSRFGKSLVRASRFFLASAPVAESSDEPDELEPVLKMGGRFLLACAFLTQCSGTLALFVRRMRHDAVTWADIRIVEVATTGILISFYWILIAARVPIFVKPVPTRPPDEATDFDKFVMISRGSTSTAFAEHGYGWLDRALRFFGNYYLCVLTLIIKSIYVFNSAPPRKPPLEKEITFSSGKLTIDFDLHMDISTPSPIKFICWAGVGIFLFGYKTSRDDVNPERRLSKKFVFARWYFIFLTLLSIDLPAVLYLLWTEWFRIYEQLKDLEASPVNQTCPLLWSDPASNWVWALG